MLKPILKEDLLSYRFLSNVTTSPFENAAVFTVAKQDTKTNSYLKNLWFLNLDNNKLTQLTKNGKAKSFIFEEKGMLLHGCAPKDKNDYHTGYEYFNIETKKTEYAFTLPFPVNNLHKLYGDLYLVNANIDTNRDDSMTEAEIKAENDYIPIKELPFWDNGIGYVSGWRNSLYIFNKADESLVKITEDLFNVSSVAVADCKKHVFFTGQYYDKMLGRHNGLFHYDVENNKLETVIPQGEMRIGSLQFVGRTLFVSASKMDKWGTADKDDWYVLENGQLKKVLDCDYSFRQNVATDVRFGYSKPLGKMGDKLVYLTTEVKHVMVNYLNENGEHEKPFFFDGSVDGFAVKDEKIIFVGLKKGQLQELFVYDGNKVKKVSNFNRGMLTGKYVGEPEYVGFEDSDGVHIDGWIIKPIDYDENKKYPALLSMHGGPCVAWGELFVHEMQMLAGQGYFVFFCNPRGSDGRGARFADLRGKYGTIDFMDFTEFTDHVLEVYPQIDKEKLGVLGGSYGGYMTNWIIGNTNRFAAAVSQRSFCNVISDFGNSCIGYSFDADQFQATPWTGLDRLWDHSPLKYAPQCTTPTLFIHSLEDYNCPLSQGFEMFSALKYHGVESEMVLFKGENHELSRSGKPLHRMRRLAEITRWFESHLK